jgi:hypothetical protein
MSELVPQDTTPEVWKEWTKYNGPPRDNDLFEEDAWNTVTRGTSSTNGVLKDLVRRLHAALMVIDDLILTMKSLESRKEEVVVSVRKAVQTLVDGESRWSDSIELVDTVAEVDSQTVVPVVTTIAETVRLLLVPSTGKSMLDDFDVLTGRRAVRLVDRCQAAIQFLRDRVDAPAAVIQYEARLSEVIHPKSLSLLRVYDAVGLLLCAGARVGALPSNVQIGRPVSAYLNPGGLVEFLTERPSAMAMMVPEWKALHTKFFEYGDGSGFGSALVETFGSSPVTGTKSGKRDPAATKMDMLALLSSIGGKFTAESGAKVAEFPRRLYDTCAGHANAVADLTGQSGAAKASKVCRDYLEDNEGLISSIAAAHVSNQSVYIKNTDSQIVGTTVDRLSSVLRHLRKEICGKKDETYIMSLGVNEEDFKAMKKRWLDRILEAKAFVVLYDVAYMSWRELNPSVLAIPDEEADPGFIWKMLNRIRASWKGTPILGADSVKYSRLITKHARLGVKFRSTLEKSGILQRPELDACRKLIQLESNWDVVETLFGDGGGINEAFGVISSAFANGAVKSHVSGSLSRWMETHVAGGTNPIKSILDEMKGRRDAAMHNSDLAILGEWTQESQSNGAMLQALAEEAGLWIVVNDAVSMHPFGVEITKRLSGPSGTDVKGVITASFVKTMAKVFFGGYPIMSLYVQKVQAKLGDVTQKNAAKGRESLLLGFLYVLGEITAYRTPGLAMCVPEVQLLSLYPNSKRIVSSIQRTGS